MYTRCHIKANSCITGRCFVKFFVAVPLIHKKFRRFLYFVQRLCQKHTNILCLYDVTRKLRSKFNCSDSTLVALTVADNKLGSKNDKTISQGNCAIPQLLVPV